MFRWLLILSFFLQKVVDRLKTDGQQAYQASDYRRALYCLDKALEIATHSLLLKTSRAECLAFLGRYTEVDNNCIQSPPSLISLIAMIKHHQRLE